MGNEFSKRAVIRVIMDAMAGLDSLKDIYDKVEAMEEPSQPELEVPAEIRDWFVKTLGDKQKFNGREVLEILQEVSEEDEGLNYRSFYNVNGNIAYYALENADIFLKLLVNCSKINGYTVKKEQLYWAVKGVTDYFRCDGKIIVFAKEEEALEVANLIGINTEVKKVDNVDTSECISIEELRDENEEALFYVILPKIGGREFCYLWTDTDGTVYTQGDKGLCIGRLKHTEQEIKAIDERYWAFAVPVDQEQKLPQEVEVSEYLEEEE